MQKTKKKGRIIKKVLLGIVLIIAAAAGFLAFSYIHRSDPSKIIQYDTTNPFIYDSTQISAHRSGAGIFPEETLMAFQNCVESDDFNIDFFEFDLHTTKDGVLVLLHDDELDRTSDCEVVFGETNVRPEDKTYEELRRLNMGAKYETDDGQMPYADLHGNDVPEEIRILSLTDILDYLTQHGDFNYIIEVKNGGELGMKSVDILYAELMERDMLDKVIFGSFNGEVSDYVDEKYPDMYRGAYTKEVVEFFAAALLDKKDYSPEFDVLQLPFGNISDSYGMNLGTAKIINYAHKNNLAVQYWTINDKKDMEYLLSIQADCIMSDYPDQLYAVKESMKYMSDAEFELCTSPADGFEG